MSRDPIDHASEAGYHQHRRAGTDPCLNCLAAHARYNQKSRRTVRFSPHESEVCERVQYSRGIGFPEWTPQKGSTEERLVRALYAVGRRGSDLNYETLLLAREALIRQVAQCAIEVDVEHWRRTLLKPDSPVQLGGDGRSISGHALGGVALVADPEQMCVNLAEMRSVQLREAQAALDLVQEALNLVEPPEPDEED